MEIQVQGSSVKDIKDTKDCKDHKDKKAPISALLPVLVVLGVLAVLYVPALDFQTAGFTPIIFAVRAGSRLVVEALLTSGARVDETAPDGSTALVVAIVNAHYDLASLLLDRGADANASGLGRFIVLQASIDW